MSCVGVLLYAACSLSCVPHLQHEAHYETSHRNRCSACGRSFPTHRLLDLHLSETHDSFFKAMAERRPMYACLVEGCAKVFQSSGKRHKHLVDSHCYPESFDFSRLAPNRRECGNPVFGFTRLLRFLQHKLDSSVRGLTSFRASSAGVAVEHRARRIGRCSRLDTNTLDQEACA